MRHRLYWSIPTHRTTIPKEVAALQEFGIDIQCQDDRTLNDTLLPVVTKLTDVRIVNNELKTMLYEPRKEYFMMVALVIGNIPLLYMLNKSWYSTLMDTIPGKIVLALSGMVILVTAMMMKYTRPIEYKR